MSAKIINGKEMANRLLKEIATRVRALPTPPGLGVVLVGNSPASQTYIGMKQRACQRVGIGFKKIHLPKTATTKEVCAAITALNQDRSIHSILVQLPLPKQLEPTAVIETIFPSKDVDGLHPRNAGQLLLGRPTVIPATPRGIMKLIESTKVEPTGKQAVVVGRSAIVGKPISLLLLQQNCTVTMCHSQTTQLEHYTRTADILVVATGKPNLVTGEIVKPGAVVIDVGINRINGILVGDVDFKSAGEVAGFITPVPGGVGPMTIACLLENVLKCYSSTTPTDSLL